ncbi:MAG: FAD-dependent oxidoreductase [Alphaproteobacteria bacterium]|nr:FAD-dependent oxidoreductase [Alphaproteobacteria bacterium]
MRLTSRTIRPTGQPITVHFDGQALPALEGETVAACLSAAGITTFRATASGAPRGLHCGMGACFDCVMTIDGRHGQRACQAKATDGMQVSSGAPASLADLVHTPENSQDRSCDLLVVGAGPAGLSAAIAAAESGAQVVVLDERDAPGGQYHKQLAPSHVSTDPDAQHREGAELRARAEAAGVEIVSNAIAWGAFPHAEAAAEIGAVVGGQATVFTPRRLVLAPGAHERPVPLPGWTLPGVLTTGGLQTLVRAQRVVPGQPVLIAGNGPLNLQLACELLAAGVRVAAVVEAAARPSLGIWRTALDMWRHDRDLTRQGISYLAMLKRRGVPVFWASHVTKLEGTDRVEMAHVATPTGMVRITATTVALNAGFQPETGLARALDLPHGFVDEGLGHLMTEADAEGRTANAAIFAVGDGARIGGSRIALARGRLAGLAIARDLGLPTPDPYPDWVDLGRAQAFQAELWKLYRPVTPPPTEGITDETIICRCEEVTAGRLRQEIGNGFVSVASLKKATRAGMGRCQGRFCAATIARLCPGTPDAGSFAAPRLPARPVPAAALMFEEGEFDAPLLELPTPNQRLTPVPPTESTSRQTDILVIGGGSIGMAAAYYLAKGGAEVMVAERDEAGMAAATANAGSLHAQLLSYDFGYDGMPEDGGPAAHTLPLQHQSIALWQEIARDSGESLGLVIEGGLMVAATPDDMEWLRGKVAMERRIGIESHLIGTNELRNLAPHLAPDLLGADWCPAEGRIDALRGTMALANLARGHGATLLRGAEVQAITRDGTKWRVETSKGPITAARVLNCGGAWGGRIGAMVGLDLPITGTVQQVIVTEPAPRLVDNLVALSRRHLSLKQQESGGLLIGGGWFGSFDPKDGRSRNVRRNMEGNLWVAARVLPALRGLSIIRSWTGIAPMLDRAPILGEAPGLPGFHNSLCGVAYTLGPICGKLAAEELLHGTKPDPRFTLDRFG